MITFFDLKQLSKYVALLLVVSGLITGCGNDSASGDDDSASENTDFRTIVIDATAGGLGSAASDPANKYTYFNLQSGEVVELTDTEATSSSDWDMAFKRSSIKLNSGDSGPASVVGSLADDQAEFYDASDNPEPSVFLNATPGQQVEALENVTETTGLTFLEDENVTQITGDGGTESWWSYNPVGHTVSANADIWSTVRGADGNSFAKFHVTNIVQASRDITVDLYIQGSSDVAFALTATTWVASIGAAGGTKCYDFDTAAEVDCNTQAATWDIQMEVTADGFGWNIWTNGGIRGDGSNGASFGPSITVDADALIAASDIPTFFADVSSGVFVESSWYAYNLQGGHRLWPNYRVYAIDTGSQQYKLQVTSYYDESGASAMINLRYDEL